MSIQELKELQPGDFIDYNELGEFVDNHEDFEEKEIYSDHAMWLVRWKYKEDTIAVIHYKEGSDILVRQVDTEVME
jgi:hypothetical protein